MIAWEPMADAAYLEGGEARFRHFGVDTPDGEPSKPAVVLETVVRPKESSALCEDAALPAHCGPSSIATDVRIAKVS